MTLNDFFIQRLFLKNLNLYPVFNLNIFGLASAVVGFTEHEIVSNCSVIQYFLVVVIRYLDHEGI